MYILLYSRYSNMHYCGINNNLDWTKIDVLSTEYVLISLIQKALELELNYFQNFIHCKLVKRKLVH